MFLLVKSYNWRTSYFYCLFARRWEVGKVGNFREMIRILIFSKVSYIFLNKLCLLFIHVGDLYTRAKHDSQYKPTAVNQFGVIKNV